MGCIICPSVEDTAPRQRSCHNLEKWQIFFCVCAIFWHFSHLSWLFGMFQIDRQTDINNHSARLVLLYIMCTFVRCCYRPASQLVITVWIKVWCLFLSLQIIRSWSVRLGFVACWNTPTSVRTSFSVIFLRFHWVLFPSDFFNGTSQSLKLIYYCVGQREVCLLSFLLQS